MDNLCYKVGVPKITKTPDIPNSQYSVGSSVTLTCIAKGNPSPSTNNEMNKYVWTFKANPGDNATELSSNNGTLILSNLEEIDTGTYTCTAFNGFNGKSFSNSFDEQLQIGEAFEIVQISSVQVSAITTARIAASVDLTFNYTLGTGDSVYSGLIVWQTKKSGTSDFENIATFSPPGRGNSSFTASESAMNLKDRAELLDVIPVGLNSFRAVMRVFEVHCSDEKEYRSSVTFFNLNTGPQTKTAVTFLTVQAPAEQPYDIPDPVPSNIEENMNFTLSCTANVGKPPGKIKWWRYRDQIDAPVLVAESSEIPTQPGVCVYNVTFSIQPLVTKDDDQSVWRCSVDNELLTGSPDQDKPNQKTDKINVFYKVGIPNLSKYPNVLNSQYSVGSSVTLTCVAKGNPSPITNNAINKYVWTFKANPGDNSTELSSNNGVLILNNLEETDTGTYTCTAFNGFNGKSFNSSIDDELYVVKTTTTPFSTASTPEWSTEYSVAQNQETEALSTENSDTQNKEEVKTTTTSFSTASTPEWSTEYSVAQNQETEVNTSLVPTTTPPLTKEPTGNQGTHSQSVEITTTVLTTTAHFESPAGPAGNSDTERQGSDDDGLSMGATVVLMVSILVIVIAILVVLKVWYNKLQRASVSRVEATIPDFSVFMDENNKPFTFHRSPMIVTNQY